MVAATAAFLAAAPALPPANALAVFAALAATLWAMGALLDGRIGRLEALFVVAAALTSAAYSLGWPRSRLRRKTAALATPHRLRRPARREPGLKRLVLAALAASLAGDVSCSRPRSSSPASAGFLRAGLSTSIAFGAAWASCRRGRRSRRSQPSPSPSSRLSGRAQPGLRLPVAAYVAMLALMVAQAAGRAACCVTRAAIPGRGRRRGLHGLRPDARAVGSASPTRRSIRRRCRPIISRKG